MEFQMLDNIFKTFTVIDTETTMLDADIGEIIEAARGDYRNGEWIIENKLYGSNDPISPDSSSKTHISNRMIIGLPKFGEDVADDLSIVCYDWSLYKVAHNAQYDRTFITKKLQKLGYDTTQFEDQTTWICTFNLAKKLLDGQAAKFNLNFLRYHLDLDVPDGVIAHRAGNDVLITAKLFEHLVMLMIEQNLLDITQNIGQQIVDYINIYEPYEFFPFGKYKGKSFSEIQDDYYVWAIENMDALKEGSYSYDARLAYTITKHFEDKDR